MRMSLRMQMRMMMVVMVMMTPLWWHTQVTRIIIETTVVVSVLRSTCRIIIFYFNLQTISTIVRLLFEVNAMKIIKKE